MEYQVKLIWSDSAACNHLRVVLRNALKLAGVLPCWQEQSLGKVKTGIVTVNGHVVYSSGNAISAEELAERIAGYHQFPKFRKPLHIRSSLFTALVIFLLPKCPFCFAAYMSALGIAGLETVAYYPWIVYLSVLMMAVLMGILFYRAKKLNNYLPLYFLVPGGVMLVLGKLVFNSNWLIIPGVLLILIASVLNSRLTYYRGAILKFSGE